MERTIMTGTFKSGSGTSNHDGPDETGRKGGRNAQPAEGEKDARGLTKDSTWMKDDAEAPVPGDAAKGGYADITKPKGD
jgi:hypothetical protein